MAKTTPSTQIATPETNDPWADIDRLFEDLRRRFYGNLGLSPFVVPALEEEPSRLRRAAADVTDTGPAYRVIAEMPGIPKEALEITVRGTTVEIRGEQKHAEERKEGEVLHRERFYRGYHRAFELPEPIVAAEAKAKLENGLLELELPKQHPTPSPGEVKVPVQ